MGLDRGGRWGLCRGVGLASSFYLSKRSLCVCGFFRRSFQWTSLGILPIEGRESLGSFPKGGLKYFGGGAHSQS